jgi:hypothetical protein
VNADSNERYPRFTVWDRETMTIAPMTEENAGRYEDYYTTEPRFAFVNFLRAFREFLRSIFTRLFTLSGDAQQA